MRRLLVLLAAACNGGSPAGPTTCTAYFSGDVSDTSSAAQCATLTAGDAGGWTLSVNVSSPKVPEIAVDIDFPSLPPAGVLSSDTVSSWAAAQNVGADACALGAGSAAVPTGSFTLSLTSVEVVHGTLDLVLHVHAPAATDCGPQNVENVEVRF